MRWIALVCTLALAGCVTTTQAPQPNTPAPARQAAKKPTVPNQAQMATFSRVVSTMEPVAERECRRRARGLNCDFKIVVDRRRGQPANAFQTLDKSGRPILAFNLAFIAAARNQHELAFVMGHEAAHHIRGHIARQRQNAAAGAILLGGIAAITGAGSSTVSSAQDIGAAVGARTYSKDFELEADALGTVITKRAGYNPIKGAQFFTQIPDPGNRFLGTHPPNAQRMQTVIRVNNSL